MEYINNKIEYPVYNSRAFQLYFGNMDIGMLDIETTGLSPKNSAFVLGGLASPTDNNLTAEQFFAENLSAEEESLQQFWEHSAAKDVLITFNGQHFDIPFIKERLNKYGSDISPVPFHLDLFLMVKNFSPIRKFLPNLKQKSIENYMGLWQYRKDEISGAESVDLYYRFLTEKTNEIKEKILLHNHDDIVQLYRLLKVIEKCDLHRALFNMGFPIKVNDTLLVVENITLKGGQLKIRGRQNRTPLEYQCYDYNGNMCYMHFNKNAGTFQIDLPLIEQSGLTLIDLEALDMSDSALTKYPACQEGFLILRSGETMNYLETNHFIKLFTERMIAQWITNR
jgi:uncharacterized protein YprB with RNaseH-like and TPR domain